MDFNVGDLVTRESYNNDIVFKIDSINENNATLKGVAVRLIADSPISDLRICNKTKEEVINEEMQLDKVKVLKKRM